MSMSRRSFIGAALATGAAAAVEEKTVDGGYAKVSLHDKPERVRPVLPPGAGSQTAFAARCVSCQLCVKSCPNKVLKTGPRSRMFRPELDFTEGWCRPECNKCSQVCPAGAIARYPAEEKKHMHAGLARFDKTLCVAARDGVRCTICSRHCPYGAITLVALDPENPSGAKVPAVDASKCTGCGACEHLCPARPKSAMTVDGLEVQRLVCRAPSAASGAVLPDIHPGLQPA